MSVSTIGCVDTDKPAQVVLPEPVSNEQIKAVFLANGFTIKEGMTDLKPYVYQAARALLATGGQGQEDAQRLQNLLCRMIDQLERNGKFRSGNAPGHGHCTPGIWDSDNGELAGKKCAWCEVWQGALEVHAALQADKQGDEE